MSEDAGTVVAVVIVLAAVGVLVALEVTRRGR
jgi:hypothetical protein